VTFETIMVSLGEEFSIRLQATPVTGYVWDVHTLPESVQLLGSDYEKPASSIQPGDPVIHVFRFRTQKTGKHLITFVLKRQWESNEIESHAVTVRTD